MASLPKIIDMIVHQQTLSTCFVAASAIFKPACISVKKRDLYFVLIHAGTRMAMLREAAKAGPLASETQTGATVVLRHHDVGALAHDPRLNGIGLTLFDMMGIIFAYHHGARLFDVVRADKQARVAFERIVAAGLPAR